MDLSQIVLYPLNFMNEWQIYLPLSGGYHGSKLLDLKMWGILFAM